jgi:hypothetical protein
MPHAAAKDYVYMSYTIPAGAGLANNVSPFLFPPPLPSPPLPSPSPLSSQQNTQLATSIPTPDLDPQQTPPTPAPSTLSSSAAAHPDPSQYARFTLGAGRRVRPGTRVAPAKAAVGVLSSARVAGTPDRAGCCDEGFVVALGMV